MNEYVNCHLQQRKSSLTNLTKNSSRQSFKPLQQVKNLPSNNHQESSSSIYNNQSAFAQKPTSKNCQKDTNQTIQFIDTSLAKSRGKVQEEQNGDYIRNLYKKYLGKENNQTSERLNAYTERKLRTAQSRQILTNKTAIKDFTKRVLYKDNENQTPIPNGKKVLRPKQSNFPCQDLQSYDSSAKNQITTQSRMSLKTKKQSVKKNDKEILHEKQKNDPKKYKSKQKVERCTNEKDHKAQTLQKSESTRLKWPQAKTGQVQSQKRKNVTQMALSGKHESKIKIKQKISQGIIHPHRQSYCQFDTEQQTPSSNLIFPQIESKQMKVSRDFPSIKTKNEISNEKVSCSIVDSKVINSCQERSFSDLKVLELILGQQNTFLKALKRINRIKQINHADQRRSSIPEERRTFIY